MSRLSEITEGWSKLIFKDKHTEQVAHARAAICSSCPEINGKTCSKCGCFLSAKVRSMKSKCPINNW